MEEEASLELRLHKYRTRSTTAAETQERKVNRRGKGEVSIYTFSEKC